MFWFQKKSYQDFHAALLAEINAASSVEWINSSYGNDACGSVMFNFDNDNETYVQLFAFETKEDAALELGEEHGTQYAITVSVEGNTNYTAWDGDDRDEAIKQAVLFAKAMNEEYVPTIEDEPDFYDALANELNQRTNQIEAEWEAGHDYVVYHWNNVNDDGLPTNVRVTYGLNRNAESVYFVITSVNGSRTHVYIGENRNTAIAFAIAKAIQIENEWVPIIQDDGFEHEGVWVTDRTKSPCGRFDLTPEQSREIYGDK